MTHILKKRQLEIKLNVNKMLELAHKDFKAAIITAEEYKKLMLINDHMRYQQYSLYNKQPNGNSNTEKYNFYKILLDVLQIEADRRVSELDDRSVEIIQYGEQ